jgi:hypothetical protein
MNCLYRVIDKYPCPRKNSRIKLLFTRCIGTDGIDMVPSRIHPSRINGFLDGVVVTKMSQSHTFSRETLVHSQSA